MYRIGEEELDALRTVIASKKLFRAGDPAAGHTQQVDKFEREWAAKIGSEYALCVSGGGTAALMCALAALGIGPGDEVIVPAYTWMATATVALAVGAIPVLAEIDETLAIDPEDVERKITPHTRASIPVHMIGRPAHMARIMDLANKHALKVVEDCCQMDGGSFHGKRVGTWGDAGAFSFNDYKILSCGEGGGWLPINSDKHVYTNWTPVWEKRIGHRPDVKPYNHPSNQGLGQEYSPDMCPRTLDILSRTVFISNQPDWDNATIAKRIGACRAAFA